MQVIVDAAHPVMAGMAERADVVVNTPPAFTTADGFEGAVIAKYPAQESPLRSGFLTPGAEKYLQGYAAALDVKHGNGHVILLAFDPHWKRMLVAAEPRLRDVASGTELERVFVAGADDGGALRVDPSPGEKAAGVVAGIVHGADDALVAGEKNESLPDLEPA